MTVGVLIQMSDQIRLDVRYIRCQIYILKTELCGILSITWAKPSNPWKIQKVLSKLNSSYVSMFESCRNQISYVPAATLQMLNQGFQFFNSKSYFPEVIAYTHYFWTLLTNAYIPTVFQCWIQDSFARLRQSWSHQRICMRIKLYWCTATLC